MTTTPIKKALSRLAVLGIFALFVGPFLFAWFLFNHSDQLTLKTVNKGTLLSPTINTNNFILKNANHTRETLKGKKWHLLFLTDKPCQQQCQNKLDLAIRIWLALGKRKDQITPVMLTSYQKEENVLSTTQFPDLTIFHFPKENFLTLTHQLSKAGQPRPEDNFFLVDGRGQIMMAYAPDTNPKDMIKDLKRLLKG